MSKALPQEGPQIAGEERNYQIGDEISLNCTSARSFPSARLTWYINDQLVRHQTRALLVSL